MKRKICIVSLVLVLALAFVLALTDCWDSEDTGPVKQKDGSWKVAGGKIILGDYTGLEFTKTVTQATDAEILAEAEGYVDSYADDTEITDRGCTLGDTVTLSVIAMSDGVENTELSSDRITLEFAGEDMETLYGDTFYAQIEGLATGEDTVFTIGNTVFTVEMLSITVPYTDGLTNEFTSEYFGYDTVDEFLAALGEYINAQYEDEAEQELNTAIFEAIRSNSTLEKYDKDKYQENVDSIVSSYSSYMDLLGAEDISEVYDTFGITEEDIETDAKDSLFEYMIILCIAEEQGLTATEEETADLVSEIMDYYGYESEDDLYVNYPKERIQYWATIDKVTAFLEENNTITTEYVASDTETETEE